MRVFADRRYYDLEYFADKDVWVKVYPVDKDNGFRVITYTTLDMGHSGTNFFADFLYIRIKRLNWSEDWVIVNEVNSDELDYDNYEPWGDLQECIENNLSDTYTYRISSIMLSEPLDMMSTDELVDAITDTYNHTNHPDWGDYD